jgi:hypothetical protein
MAQTRTSCPRCRQPVMAEINQLFDANTDPDAKQRLLSGQYNLIQCRACGYEGNLSTPLVYHDPAKELLLTFFPPDLGLPLKDQERLIGPMITKVTSNLPLEKRKAYLLRPQTMLTMQGLIEKILEGEGITKEMIQAQQKRLSLLQRLLSASSDEIRNQMLEQEKELVDESFFSIVGRMAEAAQAQGDQASARALADLQTKLMASTDVGKALQDQASETEAAIKSLQEAGKNGGLTRELLLDLMIAAPSETRLMALTSLTRSGIDYTFFELLTKRIDAAAGDDRQKLTGLRETLLTMTAEIDEEMKAQAESAGDLLEELLSAKDIQAATTEHLPEINELFVEVLRAALQTAQEKNDTARLQKLQQVVVVLQKASAPPPEVALIQELMEAPDEAAMRKAVEEHKELITAEFIQTLGSILAQAQSGEQKQDPVVMERLQILYRMALRLSMQANLKG